MIVVSDTSPISALLTVGAEGILTELFGRVVVPPAVRDELIRFHKDLPAWLCVESVQDTAESARFARIVDAGEAEAIELAKELHADRLLMDERKGRQLAIQEGLSVIGLLGVVLLARRRGMIPSARALLERIEKDAGAYLAKDLIESALKSVGE